MNRDLVWGVVLLGVGQVLTLASAFLPLARLPLRFADSAADAEARTWRRLWLPLLPALWLLGLLVGWALQEPSTTDEILRPMGFAVALVPAAIVVRACVRAARAFRGRAARTAELAATVGLLRPRVVLAEKLRAVLDAPAVAAALAHEHAHARHRDPLRVWLAQLATDLQWPSPRAARRLADWLQSLEWARDEEARREGVRGEDLAAAILAAAKLGFVHPTPAAVALTGAEADLSFRVHRLLQTLPALSRRRRSFIALAALAGVAAAGSAGFLCGDFFLRALPLIAS